jgi:hypothetical protein
MHAFDVLGDPVRRRILELLAGGEHTSGDIVAVVQREFGITQSAVSQQLRVLRDTGLPRYGRAYSVDAGRLRDWLDKFRHSGGHGSMRSPPKSSGANENADNKIDNVWRCSVRLRPLVDFNGVAPGDVGVAVEQPISKLLQDA